MNTKSYDKAIKSFNRAIRSDPNDYILYINRSICYLRIKKYEYALIDAEKSIEIKSDLAQGWSIKAEALNHLDRIHESIQSYLKAAELDPKDKKIKKELNKFKGKKEYEEVLLET